MNEENANENCDIYEGQQNAGMTHSPSVPTNDEPDPALDATGLGCQVIPPLNHHHHHHQPTTMGGHMMLHSAGTESHCPVSPTGSSSLAEMAAQLQAYIARSSAASEGAIQHAPTTMSLPAAAAPRPHTVPLAVLPSTYTPGIVSPSIISPISAGPTSPLMTTFGGEFYTWGQHHPVHVAPPTSHPWSHHASALSLPRSAFVPPTKEGIAVDRGFQAVGGFQGYPQEYAAFIAQSPPLTGQPVVTSPLFGSPLSVAIPYGMSLPPGILSPAGSTYSIPPNDKTAIVDFSPAGRAIDALSLESSVRYGFPGGQLSLGGSAGGVQQSHQRALYSSNSNSWTSEESIQRKSRDIVRSLLSDFTRDPEGPDRVALVLAGALKVVFDAFPGVSDRIDVPSSRAEGVGLGTGSASKSDLSFSRVNADSGEMGCGVPGFPQGNLMLAHPDEFQNPSSFLKIYGDPLCLGSGGAALPKKGKNGNWECGKCQNVNFPRRFRCKKCEAVRDADGDKVVAEYTRQVYKKLRPLFRGGLSTGPISPMSQNPAYVVGGGIQQQDSFGGPVGVQPTVGQWMAAPQWDPASSTPQYPQRGGGQSFVGNPQAPPFVPRSAQRMGG